MEQLSDYLDEPVRIELRREIEEHLHGCHDCSYYVDTVNKTVVLYQAARRIEIPMRATQRLHAALTAEYAAASRTPARPAD
jgi:predicted anti-sigma-YlaC factor YlaD